MSSGTTPVDIGRLVTTFQIEIEALPDGLKCRQCRGVLKDACQVVPCGCRFCRLCIDLVMASGALFCPGGSQECDGTPLLTAHEDFRANVSISRLAARCPLPRCPHECPLADMEAHLRVCPGRSADCPLGEPGGAQEARERPPQAGQGQGEILIGSLDDLHRDMAAAKRELALKDEQVRAIAASVRLVQDDTKSMQGQLQSIIEENKSIRDENAIIKMEIESMRERIESIERESERVRRLVDSLEREIDPSGDAPGSELGPVSSGGTQSIAGDIEESSQGQDRAGGRVDARCDDWVIEDALAGRRWSRTSGAFSGAARAYSYRLAADNFARRAELWVHLFVLCGPHDPLLEWPCCGAVTVSVAAHSDPARRCSQTRQCRIDRPPHNQYSSSDGFRFPFSELRRAGLDMAGGVRVSCQVAPGVDS